MQIFDNNNFTPNPVGSGVALGNFDGVHLGHKKLIETLVAKCRKMGIPAMVYTFKGHSSEVIFKRPVKLVMDSQQRLDCFSEIGADGVFLEDFTGEYAGLSPEEFVENVLVKKLNAKLVVVGYDYSFGQKGAGTASDLVSYGDRYGFKVIVLPPVIIDGEKVSSTLLRSYVGKGELSEFVKVAGRSFCVSGKVVKGRQVGRQLGFPTANILPEENLILPPFGVYATETKIEGEDVKYKSITNVGKNPTFHGDRPCTVETHIIDYNKDLYGKKISVDFIKPIRGEMKFSSPEALIERMTQDVEKVRKEDI